MLEKVKSIDGRKLIMIRVYRQIAMIIHDSFWCHVVMLLGCCKRCFEIIGQHSDLVAQ